MAKTKAQILADKEKLLKSRSVVVDGKRQTYGAGNVAGGIKGITARREAYLAERTVTDSTGKKIAVGSTTDPSYVAPKTQEQLDSEKQARINAGVFLNKSTGAYTDRYGNPVDYGGQSYAPGYTPPESSTDETLFGDQKDPETIDEALATKTYEEQAEEQYKGSYLTFAEAFEELHGKPAPWNTEAGMLEWRKTQNQEDLDYLDQQQAIARELEASRTQTALEQMEGAEAGATAAMAQSREGAMTTSKPQFISEFSAQMERQRHQIELERRSAENARQKAMQDLERAQEANDMDLVEAIQGQLASIESNIRQIDTDALNAATLANEQALQAMEVATAKSTTVSDSIFSMGSAASTLSYDQLFQMISGTDLTMPQALTIQQAAILQGKADETKDEMEAAKLQAQVMDLMMTAGKTAAQLDYEYFSNLGEEGRAEYINLRRGAPNSQLVEMGDGMYGSYDPDSQTFTVIHGSTEGGLWSGSSGTRADALNVPDGTNLGKRGSCGAFVNDYTGLGLGDSIENKLNKMNPNLTAYDAQPGDVFVSDYTLPSGQRTGHAGFIVSNNGDGTVTVKDSNYVDTNTVGTHTIDIDDILGLQRPSGEIEEKENIGVEGVLELGYPSEEPEGTDDWRY